MVAPTAGAVVLVQFPLSDLSRSKLRPAVVLADVGRGYVRPGKPFTASTELITAEVGMLTGEALKRIIDAVVAL